MCGQFCYDLFVFPDAVASKVNFLTLIFLYPALI